MARGPSCGCWCRQETPHCASVSFDRHAANAFQSYVSGALAFSIKRGGLLYGSIDEEGKALVEVIYEPEQVILLAPAAWQCLPSRQAPSREAPQAGSGILPVHDAQQGQ